MVDRNIDAHLPTAYVPEPLARGWIGYGQHLAGLPPLTATNPPPEPGVLYRHTGPCPNCPPTHHPRTTHEPPD